MLFAKLYFVALSLFFAVDMVWLGLIAKRFYAQQIGFLLTPNVHWPAAFLFYFLFVAGLVTFVIHPAVEKSSLVHALGFGAFFGLVTYATYDLTNLATVKNWPLAVTIVDLAWGAVLGAVVAVATTAIAQRWF